MRRRTQSSRDVQANSSNESSSPQGRDEIAWTVAHQWINVLEPAGAEGDREHTISRPNLLGKLCCAENYIVFLADGHIIVEKLK